MAFAVVNADTILRGTRVSKMLEPVCTRKIRTHTSHRSLVAFGTAISVSDLRRVPPLLLRQELLPPLQVLLNH